MRAPHSLIRRALCALALTSAFGLAHASGFPERTVSIVVPFPPGGSTDILARLIAEKMTHDLKHTVIVENRPGAGGNTGALAVAKARPDGYTVLISAAGPLSINHHLYAKQGYDPMRDFTPVAHVAAVPIMLVTNPQRPFQTLSDLIAYAKANPGKLTYGSQGNGTTSHLTMELLKRHAGLFIVHVPYRGSAPAAADLIGGQIDIMFDNSPSTVPHVKSNRMRALAVASPKRVPSMDNLPAISESVPGFESIAWFGIVAPAGTPDDVVATLNRSINAALKQPDVREKMAAAGVDLTGGAPADLARYMEAESRKWGEVIRQGGIKID